MFCQTRNAVNGRSSSSHNRHDDDDQHDAPNVTHIKIKLAFVIISFALALTMAPQSLSRGFPRIFPFYFHAFPAENDAQSSAKLFGEQSWHRVTAVKRELNASPLPVRRLFLCFNLYLHILFGFS